MASVSTAVGRQSKAATWILRIVVVAYLLMLVAWPTGLIARNTFEDGFGGMQRALEDPDVTHALIGDRPA